jgi:hypothetical protein
VPIGWEAVLCPAIGASLFRGVGRKPSPLVNSEQGRKGFALDDYYQGIQGARRVLKELDHLLQRVADNMGHVEALNCSIELCLEGGERVSLEKSYRSMAHRVDEQLDAAHRWRPARSNSA